MRTTKHIKCLMARSIHHGALFPRDNYSGSCGMCWHVGVGTPQMQQWAGTNDLMPRICLILKSVTISMVSKTYKYPLTPLHSIPLRRINYEYPQPDRVETLALFIRSRTLLVSLIRLFYIIHVATFGVVVGGGAVVTAGLYAPQGVELILEWTTGPIHNLGNNCKSNYLFSL